MVQPGEWVWVKTAKRTFPEPRWKGPYQVRLATPFSASLNTPHGRRWHHLTWLRKADTPGSDSLQDTSQRLQETAGEEPGAPDQGRHGIPWDIRTPPLRSRKLLWAEAVGDIVAACLILVGWIMIAVGFLHAAELSPDPDSLDSFTPEEQPLAVTPPPLTTAPAHSRRRRQVSPTKNTEKDYCLDKYGGIT